MMGATGFYVDKRYSVTTLYPGEQDGFVELVTSTGAAGYLIYASNCNILLFLYFLLTWTVGP